MKKLFVLFVVAVAAMANTFVFAADGTQKNGVGESVETSQAQYTLYVIPYAEITPIQIASNLLGSDTLWKSIRDANPQVVWKTDSFARQTRDGFAAELIPYTYPLWKKGDTIRIPVLQSSAAVDSVRLPNEVCRHNQNDESQCELGSVELPICTAQPEGDFISGSTLFSFLKDTAKDSCRDTLICSTTSFSEGEAEGTSGFPVWYVVLAIAGAVLLPCLFLGCVVVVGRMSLANIFGKKSLEELGDFRFPRRPDARTINSPDDLEKFLFSNKLSRDRGDTVAIRPVLISGYGFVEFTAAQRVVRFQAKPAFVADCRVHHGLKKNEEAILQTSIYLRGDAGCVQPFRLLGGLKFVE